MVSAAVNWNWNCRCFQFANLGATGARAALNGVRTCSDSASATKNPKWHWHCHSRFPLGGAGSWHHLIPKIQLFVDLILSTQFLTRKHLRRNSSLSTFQNTNSSFRSSNVLQMRICLEWKICWYPVIYEYCWVLETGNHTSQWVQMWQCNTTSAKWPASGLPRVPTTPGGWSALWALHSSRNAGTFVFASNLPCGTHKTRENLPVVLLIHNRLL